MLHIAAVLHRVVKGDRHVDLPGGQPLQQRPGIQPDQPQLQLWMVSLHFL